MRFVCSRNGLSDVNGLIGQTSCRAISNDAKLLI